MSYETYDYSALRVNDIMPSGVVVNGTPCYRLKLVDKGDEIDLIHKDVHYSHTVKMNISVTCRVESYYYEWTSCSSTDIEQHIFVRDVELHTSIASHHGDSAAVNYFDMLDVAVELYLNDTDHPLFVSNLPHSVSSGIKSVPGNYSDYNNNCGGSIGLRLKAGTSIYIEGPLHSLLNIIEFERVEETFWDRMINIPANFNGRITFSATSDAMCVHEYNWVERSY